MQPHEQAQFLTAVSEFVQEQVAKAVSSAVHPLQIKIEDLEAQLSARPIIEEGDIIERTFDSVIQNLSSNKYAQMNDVAQIVEHERAQTGEALMRISDLMKQMQDKIEAQPVPKDGEPADLSVVKLMIEETIKKEIDAQKELGLLADYDECVDNCAGQIHKAIAELPVPKDGKDGVSVDPEWLKGYLQAAVDEIPRPKDGKDGERGADGHDGNSVSLDDVRDMVDASVSKAVAVLPRPVELTGSVIDRDGVLSLLLSNGTALKVGAVVGKDGRSVTTEEVRKLVEEAVAELPPAKDGEPGKDGLDGVGFDGLALERITDREYKFIVGNADATKTKEFFIRIEAQINKGFWTDEVEYERGDLVTLGGSQWCCMADKTKMRPETGDGNDWQLSVKRGRDGKQGTPGPKGEKGMDGRNGRDLTQLGFDGSKS